MGFCKFLIFIGFIAISGCVSTPVITQPDPSRISVGKTQSIEFIGKRFELKFKDTNNTVKIYEYFHGNENPSDWLELVEFQVYRAHPGGNNPLDHAKRTAAMFKKKYPYMRFALLSDKRTDAAILDFFYPTSTRKDKNKEFLEFNAFKFFRDAGSSHIMSFHYAKNIEGNSKDRPLQVVLTDIKKTRKKVVSALLNFPLFRQ